MKAFKLFWANYGSGLVTLVVMTVCLVLALTGEPGTVITGKGGWLLVRLITLVWSGVISIGTYSKWSLPINWNVNLYKWIGWWIIAWEIMASFFISDWCQGGF